MRFAVSSLALLLSGCIGAPAYSSRLDVPSSFRRAGYDQHEAAGDLSRFWQRAGDPLLTDLIELALVQSPDLESARARLRQARARRDFAGAERFPTLGYSGDVSRTRSNLPGLGVQTGTQGGGQPSSFTRSRYGTGFDASWELDVFGRRQHAYRAAEADVAASAADLAATRVSLVAEVALSYVEVRSFQARVRVAQNNLESQSETLQIVEWRELAGLVTSLDVEEARRNREQTRALIPPLERGLAESEHRLAILVGLSPGELHARLSREAPIPSVPERILVGIPAETLSRRPDVRAAELRILAETERMGEAIALQYPTISLSGSLGIEGLVGNAPGFVYSLLAGITGPLWDAGRIRSQIELQRAIREETLASYRSTVLVALREVEDALIGVSTSRDRRAALEVAHEAANNAVMLARMRYETGLIDFQSVLDSQRNLLAVEDSLVTSRAEITSNVIRLYKALGGGWSPPGERA
jgi:multidrug efflux system outer membrane protein